VLVSNNDSHQENIMARKSVSTDVRVKMPLSLPEGIVPTLHVYDTHGKYVTQTKLGKDGTGKVVIPSELEGATLRYVVGPQAGGEPTLKELRRIKGVEKIRAFDPNAAIEIDINEGVITDWILCRCTVRGKVVKAFPQPTGSPVDYPVCYARVHICEVDAIPEIVWRIPDDIIWRLRDDLVAGPVPFPDPDPGPLANARLVQPLPIARKKAAAATVLPPELISDLKLAPSAYEVRTALIEAVALRWWCWYSYLHPFFNYHLDCWTTWTDESGCFSSTFYHSCNDTPDIYVWVEQWIAGSWRTIYARGPRCDTHWNYECGSELTIRVTYPDAIVCQPPPSIDLPGDVSTFVLPMAVGNLEIAGSASHPADPLGWVQTDGTASYDGGPLNIAPITDAPLGGFLNFKMLHSIDLPKTGLTRYLWSYRPTPANPAAVGGWTPMSETINRKYQVPGPGGLPIYPALALGPDVDGLFAFRPKTPPTGVWPVSGFTEDLWSAKLQTAPLAPGNYQIRVTVHDQNGAVVRPKKPGDALPSPGKFDFVVTDTRDAAKETYSTRKATSAEIIDDGFVFSAKIDNAVCNGVLHPVQTSTGAVADSCGFLRYLDKATTNVTLAFEASHPRDQAWFTLDLFRGMTDLNQVEVENGGEVGALSVGVDTNGGGVWPNASYTGDGAGNFTGTFSAARFLEACDNAAFGTNLAVRAKAHDGLSRLNGYDRFVSMAFALAQEEVA
jgi:hypothetical protein